MTYTLSSSNFCISLRGALPILLIRSANCFTSTGLFALPMLVHGEIASPRCLVLSAGETRGSSSPANFYPAPSLTVYVLPVDVMQNAADFLTLIRMPLSSQNFSTMLQIHWRFLLLLARAARSSAKARTVIRSLSLVPYLKPLTAFSIEVNRGSIAILNNIGDSGSPCFTPRNIGI